MKRLSKPFPIFTSEIQYTLYVSGVALLMLTVKFLTLCSNITFGTSFGCFVPLSRPTLDRKKSKYANYSTVGGNALQLKANICFVIFTNRMKLLGNTSLYKSKLFVLCLLIN